MLLKKREYNTYRKWIHNQLFEFAYNPLAMYQVMVEVADSEHENYEASQAAKDELRAYLQKVEETGTWPYLTIIPNHREQIGQEIEELKRLLIL